MSRPVKSKSNSKITAFFRPNPAASSIAAKSRDGQESSSESKKRPREESISTRSNKRQATPPVSNPLPSPASTTSNQDLTNDKDSVGKELYIPENAPALTTRENVSFGGAGRSFTAMSSFSSTTRSSQSSKRVVRHGEEIVKGSDTETDGSGSSLEDLGNLLENSNPKLRSFTATISADKNIDLPTTSSTTAERKLTSFTTWKQNMEQKKTAMAPKRPPRKTYEFDIDTLVRENERQTAMEVRIADAEAKLYEASESVRMESLQRTPKKDKIKAALIETNDVEDDGRARRVIEALVRTDAFERDEVWHFFAADPQKVERTPFPKIAHEKRALTTILNDPARREQAFLSGFIQRIADSTTLPEELMLWMMDEICREPCERLVSAYVETLSVAVSSHASCLAPEILQSQFLRLGATAGTASRRALISPTRETAKTTTRPIKHNVVHLVDLLGRLHTKLPPKSKDIVANFLIRTSFDHSVTQDAHLSSLVQDSLTRLLSSYPIGPEMDTAHLRIARTTYKTLASPLLQNQLIAALPRSSLITHYFRRRLALAFVLGNPKFLSEPLDNAVLTSRIILNFAKNPAFRVTSKTDYLEFRARLGMLDVALDAGFTNFAFLEEGEGEWDAKREAEKRFNADVDLLTGAIRDVMARIVDAGAAHMRRTEAKAMAERLAMRLEFAVRTREKPMRDWFGDKDGDGDGVAGGGSLEKWIESGVNKGEEDSEGHQDIRKGKKKGSAEMKEDKGAALIASAGVKEGGDDSIAETVESRPATPTNSVRTPIRSRKDKMVLKHL